MAEYPYLRGTAASRTQTDQFSGLDRRVRAAPGAVRAGMGLCAGALPALRPCPAAVKVRSLDACTDLFTAHGALIWTSGGRLYVDGIDRGGVRETRHQMAVLGRRLVLFPEKKYLTLGEDGSLADMEARAQGAATFTERTIEIAGTEGFRAGDGVTITGCTRNPENNKTAVVRAVEDGALVFSEGCFLPGGENIVQVTRTVPDLDFVCEKDNRLWGVHGNAICCSALGDPLNWMAYEGLATDGFETEVGTDGAFTGIAAASSHVLCFKEDCVHKVYGAKPSNFQVQVSQHSGRRRPAASAPSANLGETVYWWARDGLMAYGGGIPDRLSAPLGEAALHRRCARAQDGHHLWLSGLQRRSARDPRLRHRTGRLSARGHPAGRAVCRPRRRHAVPGRGGRPSGRRGTEPQGHRRCQAVFGPFRQSCARRAHRADPPGRLRGRLRAGLCRCAPPGGAWQAGLGGRGACPTAGRASRYPPARGMQFWLRLTGQRRRHPAGHPCASLHPDGPDGSVNPREE